MRRILFVLPALAGALFCCSGLWGQKDTGRPGKIVLIANGGTEYENTVTGMLKEKLETRRIATKVVRISDVAAEDARAFNAIVLMHAVEDDTLRPEVRELLKRTPTGEKGPWPYLIASTVTGRNWLSKDVSVDGITAATPVTQARNVATQLYGRIQGILEGQFK